MRNKVLKIFELYAKHRDGDKVLRAGNGYCGVYPFNPSQPLDLSFRENDTMHTCHCVFLAYIIMEEYDQELGFNEDEKLRVIEYLLSHDLGESKYGDICDDGRQISFNKVEEEFKTFLECVKGHPHEDRMIKNYDLFEKYGNGESRIMLFAKLIDKLEAVFSAFYYELTGRAGHMTYKIDSYHAITEQDEAGIKATGSDLQADVWGYHFYCKLKMFRKEYEEFYNIFCSLLCGAAIYVRQKEPDWIPFKVAA